MSINSSEKEFSSTSSNPTSKGRRWVFDLLFLLIVLAGAYFRYAGLYWGEYQYLHPDERFLVWVGTDISPIKEVDADGNKQWMSWSDYYDTQNSSLNPHNRGHSFYVYGTLPMFISRYVVEWVFGQSGFNEMTQVGRALSAAADLFVVLLVYLVAEKLYDRRVAILSAAFSAATVLQIQQSHFFTMDTFINFFSFLAFYFAVRVLMEPEIWKKKAEPVLASEDTVGTPAPSGETRSGAGASIVAIVRGIITQPLFYLSLGFGIALGMAVASKLNAAPMALVLPGALLVRLISLPPEDRERRATEAFVYLALAAVISLITFRIFQPYAFSGPGFFGLKLNPEWLANIRELRAQSGSLEVDYPPAMQWARRPVWFSAQNMVLWGLGIPLGITAWIGFLWAGWRMLKGEWRRHALIWGWTAFYFAWQSLALNPTMRYQLPIYPTLAIFAGWAIVSLADIRSKPAAANLPASRSRSGFIAAILVGGTVLVATYGWAFAFTQVYTRPVTRVEASRWIYQNIPGPLNLHIQNTDGAYNQPVPFPYEFTITPGVPYQASFIPQEAGDLSEVYLPHVVDELGGHEERTLNLTIAGTPDFSTPLATSTIRADLSALNNESGNEFTFQLDRTIALDPTLTYYLKLELQSDRPIPAVTEASVTLYYQTPDGAVVDQALNGQLNLFGAGSPTEVDFTAQVDGTITGIEISEAGEETSTEPKIFTLSVDIPGEELETVELELLPQSIPGGPDDFYVLSQPLPVAQGELYDMRLGLQTDGGAISLQAASIANEGEWDDGLPLRMNGLDGYGGVYPLDLNFNMYWDDNLEKLDRFINVMEASDYIVITSNRQWGSLPRISERYPMTTVYYRNLLGCPAERSIQWCYSVAQPGQFQGKLGYELVQIFQSNPSLGPFQINDQFAEEAFTVYDHPKVLIFKKAADFNPETVDEILGAVDFSQVIRIPPLKFGSQPANLMLPSERLAEQQENGTWSELFDPEGWINRYPWLTVATWYLSLTLIGLFTFPLLRLAFPGLPDGGYPLARTAGLLLVSYVVWLAGSFRIPFEKTTITVVLLGLAIGGGLLAVAQRRALWRELRGRKKYILAVEALALTFFLVDLYIRWSNPDLWHPWKGGEKPMDFAYFNAVLKSTSFPPYDPWYTGGYLNYYYYGFVFVGVLAKWLGIVPATAYNLIIPTIFSMIGLGAFSIVWNLTKKVQESRESGSSLIRVSPYIPAVSGAIGMAVLGNLGIVRMIWQGYQRLAAPGGVIEGASLINQVVWGFQGLFKSFTGASLPYGVGDWYWIPSRAIPPMGDVEPITEFPFFTLLYGDPHAHLFSLPITLLALTFALAVVLGCARWKNWSGIVAAFFVGGLAVGALRPTNTWDFPPYMALAVIAIGYAITVHYHPSPRILRSMPFLSDIPPFSQKIILAAAGILALIGLSFLLYQPFAQWYGLGYSQVGVWQGPRTPVGSYLIHWGLFLFLIVSWMAAETIDWMASTPLSALKKLDPYRGWIQAALLLLAAVVIGLTIFKVWVAWLVLPLAAWAGVLLLRPNQPDAKRFVLFLVGTGLVLTLMVEVIVLKGDIGRMNTVFKFYLQVWTLFAVSAAAALGWLLLSIPKWVPTGRTVWQTVLILLISSAALYPLMGGVAKMRDRMVETAPRTLDGMAYMRTAHYADEWGEMDLGQDYAAIRWMQENVKGSPVIVEANLRNLYRWGSRFSIYTGLPGVVGWEWHQQQQRALLPGSWVSDRINEVDAFYTTTDLEGAAEFLRKYNVRYIIVGQQERGHYPGPGLDKFTTANGSLWQQVYQNGDTIIYEVIQQG